VTAILYDAGALIAAERNDRAFWADHRARLEQGTIPVTPAPVVAQVSRSPRQAQLRRLLHGCDITPLTEDTRHRVARASTDDIVGGTVVAEAAARSAAIMTSDRADIAHLLHASGADLSIIDI